MGEQPLPAPSPRAARLAAPSWLDGRLVLGVLLVLVSVVVGARVLASADRSQSVWVATRDLAPGAVLGDGDLAAGQVRLFDRGARYLLASGPKPVGYVLRRGVGAQELLPREALARPQDAARPTREVSVPVPAGHLPVDLRAGQQVDVYVTGGPAGAAAGPADAAPAATRLVLPGLAVRSAPRDGGVGGRTSAVVLSVPEPDAATLVAALQSGTVDLVRVPRDDELPAVALGPQG